MTIRCWRTLVRRARVAVVLLALIVGATRAAADTIVVSNYRFSATAMPYAVALEQGLFKASGADVDRVVGAEGSGAIRAMAELKAAYAEVSPAAVVDAASSGADIRIIGGNVPSVAEYVWIARASSPVNSVDDLRGRRLAYTNANSTSEILDRLWIERAGLSPKDVVLSKVGGLVAGPTFLEVNGIDVALVAEPLWSTLPAESYKVVGSPGAELPPVMNLIAVTTSDAARDKRDFIRGVIAARRKAIQYIHEQTEDAARVIAKVYAMDPAVVERVLRRLLASEQATGKLYWADGKPDADAMDRAMSREPLAVSRATKTGWRSLVDPTFMSSSLASTQDSRAR